MKCSTVVKTHVLGYVETKKLEFLNRMVFEFCWLIGNELKRIGVFDKLKSLNDVLGCCLESKLKLDSVMFKSKSIF